MNNISFQLNKRDFLTYWLPIGIITLILLIAFPLTLSILFGYFLYPFTSFLHRKLKLPIFVSVVLTEVFILSIFLLFVFFIIQSLITLIPLIHEHIMLLPIDQLQNHPVFVMFEGEFKDVLNELLTNLLNKVTHLPSYFFEVLLFSIGLFFSLMESTKDRLWFLIFFPERVRLFFEKALVKINIIVNNFLGVEVRLIFLTFTLLAIGFSVLGMHNPIKHAFLVSLVDSIPFLGTGVVLIPLSVYFFLLGDKLFGIIIVLLYIFVQVTRHIADSMLWSKSMKMRAVHVFFLSAAAFLMFGFIGILFSPFIYLFANKWEATRKTSLQ